MDELNKKLIIEARDKIVSIMENLDSIKGDDYRMACEAICSLMQFRNMLDDIKLPSEIMAIYDANLNLTFDVIESGLNAKLKRVVSWEELKTDCQTILDTLIIYRKKS